MKRPVHQHRPLFYGLAFPVQGGAESIGERFKPTSRTFFDIVTSIERPSHSIFHAPLFTRTSSSRLSTFGETMGAPVSDTKTGDRR